MAPEEGVDPEEEPKEPPNKTRKPSRRLRQTPPEGLPEYGSAMDNAKPDEEWKTVPVESIDFEGLEYVDTKGVGTLYLPKGTFVVAKHNQWKWYSFTVGEEGYTYLDTSLGEPEPPWTNSVNEDNNLAPTTTTSTSASSSMTKDPPATQGPLSSDPSGPSQPFFRPKR